MISGQQTEYICDNPFCNTVHSLGDAQKQADDKGVIFAHGGQKIFQAVECRSPECNGKLIFCCNADKPVIDMRKLILVPDQKIFINNAEQAWILQNQITWHDYLKFQIIPAWDKSAVSKTDFIEYFKDRNFDLPILLSPEENFYELLNEEKKTGTILLVRLFPDIPKTRNLLTFLAPNKTHSILEGGATYADGEASEDLSERRKALKALIKNATGSSLEEAIIKRLTVHEIDIPLANIKTMIGQELFYQNSFLRNQLWDVFSRTDGLKQVDKVFKRIFDILFNPICTQLALAPQRKELLKWPEQAKTGKALFIDAPMGLGKTHSIVEVLASNPNLSAVIFMPTRKMCEEIIWLLKSRIAARKNIDYWDLQKGTEPVFGDDGKEVFDEEGFLQYRYKREFLENEVYYADGINPVECPKYDEFIERYKSGQYMKIPICKKCDSYMGKSPWGNEYISCRFRRHWIDAPESRIIVTTHMQYGNFLKQRSSHKWYKDGKYKKDENGRLVRDKEEKKIKNEGRDREFFIIDEDIIFSQLYMPVQLKKEGLKSFITTVSEFLATPDNYKDNPLPENIAGEIDGIIRKIDGVLAQFEKCDTSSVVPPIDKDFKLPKKIKDAWDEAYREEDIPIPDILDWSEPIGNHLDIIEKAIQTGFTVQNYEAKFIEPGFQQTQPVKNAYFPNPTTYNLSKAPPHVFFDGTMLHKKFLADKLEGVAFKKVKINVKPIWNLSVRQNKWTDLPKVRIEIDRENVERIIADLINEVGRNRKIFIVTKKAVKDAYLAEFLLKRFPDLDYVLNHFGNLRGDNKAMNCDIGVMLGSYSIPDVVEIAMAMDFIKDKLVPNKIIPAKGKDNLWTHSGDNFQRIYHDDFSAVGEIADTYRTNEQRQAIARTRYLFHDVDFYVLSKDLVGSYEPFLPEAETLDFRNDLFSKPRRKDNKYEEVKAVVLEWLKTNETVTSMEIHKAYGIRRQTVGKYLKEMLKNGLLVNVGRTKYSLPVVTDEIEE